MFRVGVTAGIGSGKSVVCRIFQAMGIPALDADTTARYLMEHDAVLVAGIKAVFGNDIYDNGVLNRPKVSAVVFSDPGKLAALNALVHPATIKYANAWVAQQHAPYVIKEAALMFESGSNRDVDVMVGVAAPVALRIARVVNRNHVTEAQVRKIIANQMDETTKMSRCNFVVINDDNMALLPQVEAVHEHLLLLAAQHVATLPPVF